MALVVLLRGVNVGGHRTFRPTAWQLTILGRDNRFVFGQYRRYMKAIGYLGTLDQLFGVPATTRNWTTMTAIAQAVVSHG